MIVGPTIKWYITGQFEWKKIRVATGFANVRIYDGLYFHKLELYVEVICYSYALFVNFRGRLLYYSGVLLSSTLEISNFPLSLAGVGGGGVLDLFWV